MGGPLLDGRGAAFEPGLEQGGGEAFAEGFRPQLAEQGVGAGLALDEQKGAEAARIVQAHLQAAVELQRHVVMGAEGGGGIRHAQAAGHAQVQEQGAGGGGEEQVLAAPAAGQHGVAGHALNLLRHGPAQAGVAHDHALDGAADEVGADAAQGGFDFRKLGHEDRNSREGPGVHLSSRAARLTCDWPAQDLPSAQSPSDSRP